MAEEEKKVAKVKRPQAVKRNLQSIVRRERNRTYKSKIKTALRRYDESGKNADDLKQVYSVLDKGAKKGILPANRVNRLKAKASAKSAG